MQLLTKRMLGLLVDSRIVTGHQLSPITAYPFIVYYISQKKQMITQPQNDWKVCSEFQTTIFNNKKRLKIPKG